MKNLYAPCDWPRHCGRKARAVIGPRARSLPLGHRGGGEVALWITLATQIKIILPGPKEATPAEVLFDPDDRALQHIARLAGLQMSKACKERAAWPRATRPLPCSCQVPSGAIAWR